MQYVGWLAGIILLGISIFLQRRVLSVLTAWCQVSRALDKSPQFKGKFTRIHLQNLTMTVQLTAASYLGIIGMLILAYLAWRQHG